MSEIPGAADGPGAADPRRAVAAQYAGDSASRALGIELVSVAAGTVQLAMRVRSDMLNGHGICHGGMVFALADTAFAYACNSYGAAMVAAGASIEFLAPAKADERLIATAAETSRSERGGIYDVTVRGEGGEVRAHFRGRCARFRPPQSTKQGAS